MKPIFVAAVAALLAGCAAPKLIGNPDPSDAAAAVPATRYVPLAAGADYGPVEPAPWKERNQRVAPMPRAPQ